MANLENTNLEQGIFRNMTKNRLEGFSDGILAVIITIMVLELTIPHTINLNELFHVLPDLLSYLLSFVVLAIFWINHHYLLHTLSHVTSKIIWANFHLLFWLSLIPFATGYMGKNSFHPYAVAFYAIILTISSIAHNMLLHIIKSGFPRDSALFIILKNLFQMLLIIEALIINF